MPTMRAWRRGASRVAVLGGALLAALSLGLSLAPAPGFGAAPGDGVTEREILIGMSAAFTGPSRALGSELYRGSMAYLTEVNRTGGVHGRTITLKAYDDGYQPGPAVANTLRLMLEDRVFLLFDYVGTPTVTRVLPLLKKYEPLHFLLFFPFSGAQPQREPPYDRYAFNLRASYRQETAGLVENFVAQGRARVAVFYQADAYGRSGWVGVREVLARRNTKPVAEATYARGAKYTESFDRQVAIVQAAKPDVIISVGAYAACAGFIRDARRAGLAVPIANVSFVGSASMLALLLETGRADGRDYTRGLVNSQVVPSYENLDLPAVREYRDLMARHDPKPPADLTDGDYHPLPYSFVGLEGFLNAKLLVEVLKRLGNRPDRARVGATVEDIRDFDLGTGQLISFGPQRNQGSDAIYYTTVKDGRFIALPDWKEWSK